jgi:hypothetical protein
VNLDKQQYIHPHKFGDGLKLLEFGCSANGTLTGLAILLADGNNRGGGDLRSDDPIIGSWAGDRIVVAGDYADGGKFVPEDASGLQEIANEYYVEPYNLPEKVNLYSYACEKFEDVSDRVIRAMANDGYVLNSMREHANRFGGELATILSTLGGNQ